MDKNQFIFYLRSPLFCFVLFWLPYLKSIPSERQKRFFFFSLRPRYNGPPYSPSLFFHIWNLVFICSLFFFLNLYLGFYPCTVTGWDGMGWGWVAGGGGFF